MGAPIPRVRRARVGGPSVPSEARGKISAPSGVPDSEEDQPADEPDVAPAVSRLIDDSGIGTQPGRLRVS
jgi:hypothetical protein